MQHPGMLGNHWASVEDQPFLKLAAVQELKDPTPAHNTAQ